MVNKVKVLIWRDSVDTAWPAPVPFGSGMYVMTAKDGTALLET